MQWRIKSPTSRLFALPFVQAQSRKNIRVTALCEGNPPVTNGFPSQRASTAVNVSIWWRHRVIILIRTSHWFRYYSGSVVTVPSLICPVSQRSTMTGVLAALMKQWASYQIRKIAGCACAGNAGNVFPRRRFQRKPLVSDPGMHHGTGVSCRDACRDRVPAVAGKTFPTFPAHAHPQFHVSGKRPMAKSVNTIPLWT